MDEVLPILAGIAAVSLMLIAYKLLLSDTSPVKAINKHVSAFIMGKALRNSIIVGIGVITLSVAHYYLVFLPKNEESAIKEGRAL